MGPASKANCSHTPALTHGRLSASRPSGPFARSSGLSYSPMQRLQPVQGGGVFPGASRPFIASAMQCPPSSCASGALAMRASVLAVGSLRVEAPHRMSGVGFGALSCGMRRGLTGSVSMAAAASDTVGVSPSISRTENNGDDIREGGGGWSSKASKLADMAGRKRNRNRNSQQDASLEKPLVDEAKEVGSAQQVCGTGGLLHAHAGMGRCALLCVAWQPCMMANRCHCLHACRVIYACSVNRRWGAW